MLRSALIVILVLAGVFEAKQVSSGPLYDYVHRYDPVYTWSVHSQYENDGVMTYILNLTSLQWQTEELVDTTVWHHWVDVSVPPVIKIPDASFMNVASGNIGNSPPDSEHAPYIANMSRTMGMVAAEVVQVPNQPLSFNGGRGRTEDDLIAHTWNLFMDNTSDPELLVRMAMVKASVRAMDAVTEFIQELTGNTITKWMTSGDSKRGWVSWLHPAVDDRVVAIAPSVLSMVNFEVNLDQHYRSLGGWTFAFWDYYTQGVTERFNDPEFTELELIEDPWEYRELLTVPKFIIKASSDEFFLPDDTRTYMYGLPDPTYIWLVENNNHDIIESVKWPNIEAFYLSILTETPLPNFSWEIKEGPTSSNITMTNNDISNPPTDVTVWYADSVAADRRDWRHTAGTVPRPTDIEWFQTDVEDLGDGRYFIEFAAPESGYRAFNIKATFTAPEDRPLIITTEAAVVPNDYPYPGCGEELCRGIIV